MESYYEKISMLKDLSSSHLIYLAYDSMYIDKLALIYIRDGSILSTRSKGKSTYYIPWGKREGDETDHDALVREIKEELSVDVAVDSIRYYGTFEAQAHGKQNGLQVKMTCYCAEFSGDAVASSEIEEIVWLRYRDKKSSSQVDQLIFDDLYKKGLICY